MASSTNERQVAEAKRRQAAAESQDREIIALIMSKGAGRAWVFRQLTASYVFDDGNTSVDHGVLAFEKGRRTAGLRLLAQINQYASDMYVRMMQENAGLKVQQNPEQQDEDND